MLETYHMEPKPSAEIGDFGIWNSLKPLFGYYWKPTTLGHKGQYWGAHRELKGTRKNRATNTGFTMKIALIILLLLHSHSFDNIF